MCCKLKSYSTLYHIEMIPVANGFVYILAVVSSFHSNLLHAFANVNQLQDDNTFSFLSSSINFTLLDANSNPSFVIHNNISNVTITASNFGYSEWFGVYLQNINHQIYEGYQFREGVDINTYYATQLLYYVHNTMTNSVDFIFSSNEPIDNDTKSKIPTIKLSVSNLELS